jgi:hypothetical protein
MLQEDDVFIENYWIPEPIDDFPRPKNIRFLYKYKYL